MLLYLQGANQRVVAADGAFLMPRKGVLVEVERALLGRLVLLVRAAVSVKLTGNQEGGAGGDRHLHQSGG